MMFDFLADPASKADKLQVEKEIQRITAKYEVTFPQDLYNYALAYDGAKINLCIFKVNGYTCEVSKIVPICGDGLTFEKIVNNDRADGFISERFYPLAADRGGDIYYWDAWSGAIYLVLTDDIENPFKVCNSVREFFELLTHNRSTG